MESFSSRADFLAKASLYRLYFNLARPNSHKGGYAPWQIIQQLDRRLPLDLCLLPPVFSDYRLDSYGGYDVPGYPYYFQPDRVLAKHSTDAGGELPDVLEDY